MHGARRQIQSRARIRDELAAVTIERRIAREFLGGELGVESARPLLLEAPRGRHSRSSGARAFTRCARDTLSEQIVVGDHGNLDAQIDAIEQRSGKPGAIARDFRLAAATAAGTVAEISAGT